MVGVMFGLSKDGWNRMEPSKNAVLFFLLDIKDPTSLSKENGANPVLSDLGVCWVLDAGIEDVMQLPDGICQT